MVGKQILGDRVKTLSREVHAGLLAQMIENDLAELEQMGVPVIDVACLNFYPLEAEITRDGSTPESVLKQTDIGGPTMARSGAKGRRIVACDPKDYDTALQILDLEEADNYEPAAKLRRYLAAKAESVVASYCLASARYTSGGEIEGMIGTRAIECVYGENAHQKPAGYFSTGSDHPLALEKFALVAGTTPSFNNLGDLSRMMETAISIAVTFEANNYSECAIAVAGKHRNPCGAAIGHNRLDVLRMMIAGDRDAILGGVVAVNFPIGHAEAEVLFTHLMPPEEGRKIDVLAAPSFTADAVELLRRKKDKLRFFQNPALVDLARCRGMRFEQVIGGFIGQPSVEFLFDVKHPGMVRIGRDLTRDETDAMILAYAILPTANSNTIVITNVADGVAYLVAGGFGQQSRVVAAKLAVMKARLAGHALTGTVAAGDSFFPFSDGALALADEGIGVLFATSGSINDAAVQKDCADRGLTLWMLPDKVARAFRH